ncbi:ribosome maturation factor RimM [Roseomonas sp. GC11]|uniref:ribosome maturation factor RimM n=1 Tax=Roseomonas sp. GC11 TaxID=2950546 RepID=UPI00210B4CFA|nr:ribosome maturation factor RimM [Roseomonas sp. GC11]MCQ4159594.1 ribosome maturation factor RimM [Roseomonas sp. GC11]
MPAQRILVGEIGRPHGVRGLVRINPFTADPAAIATYGPLLDESGARRFVLHWQGNGLARIDGVNDRDAAARLTGTRLYADRDRLPGTEEEEFYLADLIGLAVRDGTPNGTPDAMGAVLGTVRAVEDYGAGAFLTVLDAAGKELLLPFTRAVVPVVAVAEGYLLAVPPADVIVPPQPGEEEAAEAPLAEATRPLPRRQDAPKRSGPRGVRGGAA